MARAIVVPKTNPCCTYSQYGSLAPVFGQLGFGLHQRVSERLAFRPEIQLVTFYVIPIGARVLAGLSVDLGR
jgi:hypothetical protein